jgi:hypothetical protein
MARYATTPPPPDSDWRQKFDTYVREARFFYSNAYKDSLRIEKLEQSLENLSEEFYHSVGETRVKYNSLVNLTCWIFCHDMAPPTSQACGGTNVSTDSTAYWTGFLHCQGCMQTCVENFQLYVKRAADMFCSPEQCNHRCAHGDPVNNTPSCFTNCRLVSEDCVVAFLK